MFTQSELWAGWIEIVSVGRGCDVGDYSISDIYLEIQMGSAKTVSREVKNKQKQAVGSRSSLLG